MRFSVVIPAFNEEQYLPRLLVSIEAARTNYSGGGEEVEVIVADNDSTDRTAEVAATHDARVADSIDERIEPEIVAQANAHHDGGLAQPVDIPRTRLECLWIDTGRYDRFNDDEIATDLSAQSSKISRRRHYAHGGERGSSGQQRRCGHEQADTKPAL